MTRYRNHPNNQDQEENNPSFQVMDLEMREVATTSQRRRRLTSGSIDLSVANSSSHSNHHRQIKRIRRTLTFLNLNRKRAAAQIGIKTFKN